MSPLRPYASLLLLILSALFSARWVKALRGQYNQFMRESDAYKGYLSQRRVDLLKEIGYTFELPALTSPSTAVPCIPFEKRMEHILAIKKYQGNLDIDF